MMFGNRSIGLVVLSLLALSVGARAADPPPNVVIIYTDDQGYGDLACFGGKVHTPRIDALAAQGARLTTHYAAPLCTQSRAALMTGCYPVRVGLGAGSRHAVLLSADAHGLHPDEATIADVLKSAGYATGCFGKWHLGDQPAFLPTRQGFDVFFGLPYSHDIHPDNNRKHEFAPLPMLDGEEVVEVDPDPSRLTRTFTDKAIAFIREHRDRPFFVYLPHPMPHRPIDASPAFIEKFATPEAAGRPHYPNTSRRDGLLAAAIAEIDHETGRIVDVLDELGLTDRTVIVFATDNGPAAGSAGPLRGRKGSILEGGIRVPCVVRWPGVVKPGATIGAVTSVMDWLPTFAAAAGATLDADRVIDGHDLRPLLAGETDASPYDVFLYYQGRTMAAVRKGPWKLVNGSVLFNLDDDIHEDRNVAGDHAAVVDELRAAAAKEGKRIADGARPVGKVADPVPLVR